MTEALREAARELVKHYRAAGTTHMSLHIETIAQLIDGVDALLTECDRIDKGDPQYEYVGLIATAKIRAAFAAKAADPTEPVVGMPGRRIYFENLLKGKPSEASLRASIEVLLDEAELAERHCRQTEDQLIVEAEQRAQLTADRDRLRAAVDSARALCDNAEDPIYGWVSRRNFDGSIAPAYVSVPNVRAALDQPPANITAGEADEPDNEPCPEGRTDYDECFSPFRYCPVKGCGRVEGGRKL